MMEGDSARGIITFDRFGTDKLVCRADPIERVTMVRNTISSIIQITFESFFLRLYVSLSNFLYSFIP